MLDKVLYYIGDVELTVIFCTFMVIQLTPKPSDVPRWRWVTAIVLAVTTVAANLPAVLLLTESQYMALYNFICVAPFFFYFWMISRYSFWKVLFVFLSSLVFAAPCSYFLRLATLTVPNGTLVRLILRAVVAIIEIIIMRRTVCKPLQYMLDYTEKGFPLVCATFLVWFAAFTLSRKSYLMGMDSAEAGWLVSVPIFIIGLLFYLLLIFRFRTTREDTLLKAELDTVRIQMSTIAAQTEQQKEVQTQIALFRHDMKHYAALLDGLISSGEYGKAQELLRELDNNISVTALHRYCENETVNLVLSYYLDKAQKANVQLHLSPCIPSNLTASDADLSILFANTLDNALHALASEKVKSLYVKAYSEKSRLFVEIKNNCTTPPTFRNGLPVAQEDGHGYGTKSVALVISKRHGQYYFGMEDNFFVFRCCI